MVKIYSYSNCSSCKKAIQFLDTNNVTYELHNLPEQRPSTTELKTMLAHYDDQLKKLFNVSGKLYRELSLKDKLPSLSTNEALKLLGENGMLIKRPFLLTRETGLLGFKEELWTQELL